MRSILPIDQIRILSSSWESSDESRTLGWACEQGLARGVAVMDPGYGHSVQMRAGVTAVGLTYVAGIQSNTLAWPPGAGLKRRGEV